MAVVPAGTLVLVTGAKVPDGIMNPSSTGKILHPSPQKATESLMRVVSKGMYIRLSALSGGGLSHATC